MTISFTLHDKAVNDQTTGLQIGDSGDGFTDTDVAYAPLPSTFRTFLETTLGLSNAFPTSIGVATMANSVTVDASAGSQLTGIVFTDSSGGALDGDDSGLKTLDGKSILLFASGNNIVIGKYDSDGDTIADAVAFVIFKDDNLNATNTQAQVTFTIATFVGIKHPDATDPDDAVNLGNNLKLAASELVQLDFADLPSGQNLFGIIAIDKTDLSKGGLLLFPKGALLNADGTFTNDSPTTNTSKGGGAVTIGNTNQMFDPGEGHFFIYVDDPAAAGVAGVGLDQNNADDADTIGFNGTLPQTGAQVEIVQVQGNDTASIKITAYDFTFGSAVNTNGEARDLVTDPLDANATDLAPTSVAPVSITRVKVFDQNGNLIEDTGDLAHFNDPGVAVTFAGGVATVSGLNDNYTVEWRTSAPHDGVLIEGVAGKYDLGGFNLISTATASQFVGQQIVIEDDGPTAAIALTGAAVAHDETAGVQADANDTTAAGVAALFAGVTSTSADLSPAGFAQNGSAVVNSTGSSSGTDSLGATTVFSLAVSAAGVDSGLDTTDGTSIFLFKEGGLVVGRIGGALGDAAFAVAINSSTGVISIAQWASIKHPNTANPDDSVSVDNTALQAVVTVTDGDGDVATNSVNIGAQIQIQDDGPTADIVDGGGTTTIDETAGNQNNDSDAAAVLALFDTEVVNKGTDLSPTEFAISTTPLVSVSGSTTGNDEEGATTAISLAIVGGNGTDSGLDTTNGTSIFLFKEGDLVVGRIGSAAGAAAFAIAIQQDGNAAIAQYVSLKHPDTTNPDDQVDLTGKVNAVVTVTDGDGDASTDTFGIGDKLNFDDDGPALADPNNTVVSFVNSTLIDAVDSDIAEPGVETDGDDHVAVNFNPGQDQEGASLVITDFTDPDDAADLAASGLGALEAVLGNITATKVGNTVTYFSPDGPDAGTDPDPLFKLTLNTADPESYDFQVFQDTPMQVERSAFFNFGSGSPVETIKIDTEFNVDVVFDGLLFNTTDARDVGPSQNLPNDPADDLNPDNLGFGVKNGQASNINNNEGWKMNFVDNANVSTDVQGISFEIEQQGNTDDVVLAFQLTNNGPGGGNDPTLVNVLGATGQTINSGLSLDGDSFFVHTTLPNGNNALTVTIIDDDLAAGYTKAANEILIVVNGEFDQALFQATFPQDPAAQQKYTTLPFENDSIRVQKFALVESVPGPDVQLSFSVQGTDGDGDPTLTQTFTVGVDGNLDGLINV